MEIKFEARLAELGLSVDQLSAGLKDKIKEFYKTLDAYNNAVEELQTYDGDNVEAMENELSEIIELVYQADDNLVYKINLWDKNKEVYAKNALLLKNSKKPNLEAVVEPIVVEPTKAEEVKVEEKKEEGSSLFWWVLVGVIAVGTLGNVILKKK